MELSEGQRNHLIEFLALHSGKWLRLKRQYLGALRGASKQPVEVDRSVEVGAWFGHPVEAVGCMVKEIESWDLSDSVEGVLTSELWDAVQFLRDGNMIGAMRKMNGLIDRIRGDASGLTAEQVSYLSTWAQYIRLLISDRSID